MPGEQEDGTSTATTTVAIRRGGKVKGRGTSAATAAGGRGRGGRGKGFFPLKKKPNDKKKAVMPARVKVKKEVKVKREVKVKKEVKVKREVKVKQEPGENGSQVKKGLARGAMEHYCHQVKFIDQMVKRPWTICFGALGTGIVAVRPKAKAKIKKEIKEEPSASPEAAGASSSSSSSTATASASIAPSSGGVKREDDNNGNNAAEDNLNMAKKLPLDATMIIFVHAPKIHYLQRNGKTVGGYKEELDTVNNTLVWSSQRGDKQNRRINTIIDLCKRGGRVVVGVRPADQQGFVSLGELSKVDNFQGAQFLVADGDDMIQEVGTILFHKAITAACLHKGLLCGTGLSIARYPRPEGQKTRFCLSCCYTPPKATFHFRELVYAGVEAFNSGPSRKREPKQEDDGVVPVLKRLRGKQPLIKSEQQPQEDEASSHAPVGSAAAAAAATATSIGVHIKTEPVDEEPIMAEPV